MARILVIDDDAAMRRITSRLLAAAGHSVADYPNGRGAIEHIEKDPPDLLITDIFMPEMEGLETIRRARELQAGLPIIAMSGISLAAGNYLPIAEKFGAVATLKKPFQSAELLELVARLLTPPEA